MTTSKVKVRGVAMWRVRWREDGKIRRKFFQAKIGADNHAASLRGEMVGLKDRFAALATWEQKQLLELHSEANRRQVDLFAVMAKLQTVSGDKISIKDAIREMLASKTAGGLAAGYRRDLECWLDSFAKGRQDAPIASFTLADVSAFIAAENPASRRTARSRLSALFSFAFRKGYVSENPCQRLESQKYTATPPKSLTVEQVKQCLAILRQQPRALAWFVLSTFAGLRPHEADRTQWSAIDFDGKLIRVEAQTSKMRQRRIVYPQPVAFEWLKLAKELGSQLPIGTRTREAEMACTRSIPGLERWPVDATRHTAASMWLALTGEAGKVANQLGHSEQIMRKHYMALVTREEAERFFALQTI